MQINLIAALLLLSLSACSFYPYQNKVACRLQDASGKCVSVQDAYDEAVTGEEKYAYLKKRKYTTVKTLLEDDKRRKRGSTSSQNAASPTNHGYMSAEEVYNTRRLELLSELIGSPTTPMLTPMSKI